MHGIYLLLYWIQTCNKERKFLSGIGAHKLDNFWGFMTSILPEQKIPETGLLGIYLLNIMSCLIYFWTVCGTGKYEAVTDSIYNKYFE